MTASRPGLRSSFALFAAALLPLALLLGGWASGTDPSPHAAPGEARTAPSDTLPSPSPDMSPKDAVEAQVEALASNDSPYENAGLETAYRFAAPEDRQKAGSMDRFVKVVGQKYFRPLIGHAFVRYSPVQRRDDTARVGVIVTTSGGERVGYLYTLRRLNTATCEGCWLTDGVKPIDLPEAPTKSI